MNIYNTISWKYFKKGIHPVSSVYGIIKPKPQITNYGWILVGLFVFPAIISGGMLAKHGAVLLERVNIHVIEDVNKS